MRVKSLARGNMHFSQMFYSLVLRWVLHVLIRQRNGFVIMTVLKKTHSAILCQNMFVFPNPVDLVSVYQIGQKSCDGSLQTGLAPNRHETGVRD